LDDEIITGCSLAGFKRKLHRHLREKLWELSSPLLSVSELNSLVHQVQVKFKPIVWLGLD